MNQGKRSGHGNASQSRSKNASRTHGVRRNFIGKQRRIGTFAEAFRSLCVEDERAAETLQREGCYRQAVYFYIQTMEKLTRFAIFSEVAPGVLDKSGTTYRERTLTHNLDELLTVLLEVYKETINDSRVSEQIEKQLSVHVLQGVRFGALHNDVRYPRYMDQKRPCLLLELTEKDSATLAETLARLKLFVEGFQQLKGSVDRQQPTEPATTKRTAAEPRSSGKPVSEFRF